MNWFFFCIKFGNVTIIKRQHIISSMNNIWEKTSNKVTNMCVYEKLKAINYENFDKISEHGLPLPMKMTPLQKVLC